MPEGRQSFDGLFYFCFDMAEMCLTVRRIKKSVVLGNFSEVLEIPAIIAVYFDFSEVRIWRDNRK